MNQVVIPSDFILRTQSSKLVTSVIFTSQVAQTFATLDTQSKIIFNDGHLHLTPNMVIELSIHPLHLTRMACELTQRWKSKNDVSIKKFQKQKTFCMLIVLQFNVLNSFEALGVKDIALKHLGTLTTLDLLGSTIVPRSFILKGIWKQKKPTRMQNNRFGSQRKK